MAVFPATIPIIQAVHDKNLLGGWFKQYDSWQHWFTFLKALFALPMNAEDRKLYQAATGRLTPPQELVREAYVIVGRRGGKSAMLALVATYLACFVNWKPYLSPGEFGSIQIIAADRKQARTIFRYIRAMIMQSPMLRYKLASDPTAGAIELKGQVVIEIMSASLVAVRSYTVIAALLDEMAFWRSDESANPDQEIITALQPAMASVPFSMLLAASSPFAKRGVIYNMRKDYWGEVEDQSVLVWHTDTMTMNPIFDKKVIDKAMRRDPTRARTEYEAEFRSDIESPITDEMVDDCTDEGVHFRMPMPNTSYLAFVDPSGGSVDDMTLAIGHFDFELSKAVVDRIEIRKPPFSPDKVTAEFAAVIKEYSQYQLASVWGDAYGGVWPAERFAKHGVSYMVCPKSKSDLYGELIPLLMAGRCDLVDLAVLKAQLVSLERRQTRSGKVIMDHPPNAHDDVANVAAGVCVMAAVGQIDFDIQDVIISEPMQSSQQDFGGSIGTAMEGYLGYINQR